MSASGTLWFRGVTCEGKRHVTGISHCDGNCPWLSLLVPGSSGLAQSGRAWVDPPDHLILKSEPEESPPTRVPPQTAPEEAQTGHDATSSTINTGGSTAPELPPAVQPSLQAASAVPHHAERAAAARDLAFDYLDRWSAPNQVALASAPSFYGSTVLFHGKPRSFASVLAEKRRFAERWPDRTYRYRAGDNPGGLRDRCGGMYGLVAL